MTMTEELFGSNKVYGRITVKTLKAPDYMKEHMRKVEGLKKDGWQELSSGCDMKQIYPEEIINYFSDMYRCEITSFLTDMYREYPENYRTI